MSRPLSFMLFSLSFGLALAPACAGTGDGDGDGDGDAITDLRVDLPDAPAEGEGIQLVQPDELVIESGQEIMWCWVPEWVPEEDFLMREMHSYQAGIGHHLSAFRSEAYLAPGTTFECTNQEQMATIRLLMNPIVELHPRAVEYGYTSQLLPEGFAVRMKANTTIVMQSHYINATENKVRIKDAANIYFVPEAEAPTYTEASWFIINHGGVNIPQGAVDFTTSVTCTPPQNTNLISLLGHMHDWGTRIDVTRTRADTVEPLYEIPDWIVDFRDEAPIKGYTLTEPLALETQDTITVNCTYDNDTDGALTFPKEMCVAFGAYFPANNDGEIVCE